MKTRLFTVLAVLTGMILISATIVWAAPAPVAKTGQTISHATGDDGDLEKGVPSPNPRFTDNNDNTVTDNLTGLMWAKDANLFGRRKWTTALNDANNLSYGGVCGTSYTDWRLPNIRELTSLIDYEVWPVTSMWDSVFDNVQLTHDGYWSSTSYGRQGRWNYKWFMGTVNGDTVRIDYDFEKYVWPVRGGN